MNLRTMINQYTECNEFEIKIKNKKIYIYYYDLIEHFNDDKIIISKNNKKLIILGKKLVINSLYKEYLIIIGNINEIILKDFFGDDNE